MHNTDHFLCVCGDAFDRGPKSEEVLQFLQQLRDRLIYIRGNHEDLLFECVKEITEGKTISVHHFSNGTVGTIEQFCGLRTGELTYVPSPGIQSKVKEKMTPILDWIDSKAVNYAQIGDYILVHGWIPCNARGYGGQAIAFEPLPDWRDASNLEWSYARWYNGMAAARDGVIEEGKTIICGHWHCSYGWSHIKQKRKEFPSKNRPYWKSSFEPYRDKGIIAIDSCCAYSGFLNCITVDLEEHN